MCTPEQGSVTSTHTAHLAKADKFLVLRVLVWSMSKIQPKPCWYLTPNFCSTLLPQSHLHNQLPWQCYVTSSDGFFPYTQNASLWMTQSSPFGICTKSLSNRSHILTSENTHTHIRAHTLSLSHTHTNRTKAYSLHKALIGAAVSSTVGSDCCVLIFFFHNANTVDCNSKLCIAVSSLTQVEISQHPFVKILHRVNLFYIYIVNTPQIASWCKPGGFCLNWNTGSIFKDIATSVSIENSSR